MMRRVRAGASVFAAALIIACKPPAPPRQVGETGSDVALTDRSPQLLACAEQATVAPWRVTRATARGEALALYLEADSNDLLIPRRPANFREQRVVQIELGRFREYRVVDPGRLSELIGVGAFIPSQSVGDRSAEQMTPFVPYTSGASIVLVNLADQEFCVTYPASAEVPNPFVRCQLIRGDYTATVIFAGDALEAAPELFVRIRDAIARVFPCIERLKGANQ